MRSAVVNWYIQSFLLTTSVSANILYLALGAGDQSSLNYHRERKSCAGPINPPRIEAKPFDSMENLHTCIVVPSCALMVLVSLVRRLTFKYEPMSGFSQ